MPTAEPAVLDVDDLNDTDSEILDELQQGRVTPALVADRRDIDRSYVSQRLIRLEEHGHVDELRRGLYELVDDPRRDGGQDVDEETRDARQQLMAEREQREDLEAELEQARERIADLEDRDRQADVDADLVRDDLERALAELPDDVPGRTAVQDAAARLE